MKCPKCGSEIGINRIYDFNEFTKQRVYKYSQCRVCSVAWTDWQQKRIADLEQELAKYKLKWQTGKPLTTGWYWFNDPLSHYISITWLMAGREYKKWAGPIEPPENEG